MEVCFIQFWSWAIFECNHFKFSQRSVVMHLRCGWIFNYCFTINFLQSLSVHPLTFPLITPMTDRLSVFPRADVILHTDPAVQPLHCTYSAASQLAVHIHSTNTNHATLMKYDIWIFTGFLYSISGCCQNSIFNKLRH